MSIKAIESKTAKQLARELIERLPDNVSWNEISSRLRTREMLEKGSRENFEGEETYENYVRETIEQSLSEFESGEGIPHEEVKKMLKKWFE